LARGWFHTEVGANRVAWDDGLVIGVVSGAVGLSVGAVVPAGAVVVGPLVGAVVVAVVVAGGVVVLVVVAGADGTACVGAEVFFGATGVVCLVVLAVVRGADGLLDFVRHRVRAREPRRGLGHEDAA
jgi:hypothetical protein